MKPQGKSKRSGFSLIELVIVVVIIGIIAAIAIPRLSRGSQGAADSALSGNLAVLRAAIELYATEHGRSGAQTGYDELNKIEKGKNYGWPVIEGPAVEEGMVTPLLQSGPTTTWAPASALFYKGSIFFGGLKGEALYEAILSDPPILKVHLLHTYGRIRTVKLGPDGMFYLTTSNTDGRGSPVAGDDRIVRIDPEGL